MLSEKALDALTNEFVKQPFTVPSPAAGMQMLAHADAMFRLALIIAEEREHAGVAMEITQYASAVRGVAGTFAVLQTLPIEMLRTYVQGRQGEPTDGTTDT